MSDVTSMMSYDLEIGSANWKMIGQCGDAVGCGQQLPHTATIKLLEDGDGGLQFCLKFPIVYKLFTS